MSALDIFIFYNFLSQYFHKKRYFKIQELKIILFTGALYIYEISL